MAHAALPVGSELVWCGAPCRPRHAMALDTTILVVVMVLQCLVPTVAVAVPAGVEVLVVAAEVVAAAVLLLLPDLGLY